MKLTTKVKRAWLECKDALEGSSRVFTDEEKFRRLQYLENAQRRYEKYYGVPFNIVTYAERLRR